VIFISALAAVFLFMMLLLNLLLHYVIVKPMRQIAAVATEVSLGQMDAPELVPRGSDEVAQLTESFNRMRRSLANAMRLLAD
jgi:protein-histidine pros-kinase